MASVSTRGGTAAAAADRTSGDRDGAPAVPTASTTPKPAAAPSPFQYVSGQERRDSVSAPKEGKRRESRPAEPGRDRDQQSAVDQARQPRSTHPEQRQSAGRGIESAQSRGLAGESGIVGVGRGDELPGREPEQSEERDELPALPRPCDGDRRGRGRDQQDDRGGAECRRVVAAGPEDEHARNRKRKSTCSGWDDRGGGRPLHLSFAGRSGQRPQKGVRRARSRSARPAPARRSPIRVPAIQRGPP